MQHSFFQFTLLSYLLLAVPTATEDEYGLFYFNFDPDPLTASCNKQKPVIFELMYDFLTMIKAESAHPIERCVVERRGPGFTSPPGVARNIFAVMTMSYNTYARYTAHAKPALNYDGWTRMLKGSQAAPDCAYIYGFYHIADFFMHDRMVNYTFRTKYEKKYGCNLTQVPVDVNSELGLVQRDIEILKPHLLADGFNQGGCFADTTNFKTVNPPCRLDNRSTIEICRNFTHTHQTIWNYGEMVKTGYVETARTTALSQSQRGRPFSLERLYDYLAPPYFDAAAFENGTMMNLKDQFLEVVNIQSHLNEDDGKSKLIAEYWAGGPGSTGTPGHWQSIAMNVIRRLCYDNNDAVKLLFAVSAAVYDAGLAAWQNKRLYNTVRPATYIPTEHIDTPFSHQFVGMYCDFQNITGWEWSPYQEDRVITPEFQEYISGHSTFSRAASYILEKFTGKPDVPGNLSVTIKPGESLFQPRCLRNESCFRTCRVNSTLNSENNYLPKVAITLGPWKTYRDIANEASISRKYGGIHIASGDIQGRLIGQKVGETVWRKVFDLFNDSRTLPVSNSKRLNIHYITYYGGYLFILYTAHTK